MVTFALISEGVTDQVILEHLIELVCAGRSDQQIFFNEMQPARDKTDSHHAPHGGWGLVLEACTLLPETALAANDYLVIQIDTDCGDDAGFGVPLTVGGVDRPVRDVLMDTKALLISKIDPDLYASEGHRIIFAVCVHSLEGWILLLVYNDDSYKGCENRLQRTINRRSDLAFEKTERRYERFCPDIRAKILRSRRQKNESLEDFISQLEAL